MQLRTIDGHDLATAESSFRRPVAIVVLAWNGLAYTRKCLDSITRTLGGRHRIIVVDNGSTDGTVEYLRAQTGIQTVLNSSNLGYAAGNNLGLQLLDLSEDVVLLNNDTELRQGNWLELLQEAAYSSDKVGIVGCRLVRPDGMLQHVGVYMPLDSLWGQQIGAHERDVGQFSSTREVESVVFACVYIKRTVIDVVGRLDEDYFSYFEDTDYCLRAREKGFKILCCGSATVVHHENVSTTLNAVPHEKMFRKARSVFRAKWDERLRNTRYDRKLSWHSLFNFPSGYAISSRELAVALDSLGVWVSYKYVYGPGTVFPVQEKELNENFRVEMIRSRPWDPGDMQVVYGQGDVFRSNSGRYKIGFTMLETDRIPDEWVRQANRMDEVWVPSTFNVDTFRRSGVIRPLHVVPLGVDPGYFNPDIHRRPLTGLYTFLSIFEWGERKAPEMLLQAFNDEFSADEPVVLVCKVLNSDPAVDVPGCVGSLALKPAGGSIHISLNQVTPTYQLGVLYRSADCFVLPTRGEGWGMPVIEAMACGLPVIATDWSAHRDFMNEQNAYPLPIEGLVSAKAKCPYYTGFRWAQPSYFHLRRLLRHVYSNQAEARDKGVRASAETLGAWTWTHAAHKILARLNAIQPH